MQTNLACAYGRNPLMWTTLRVLTLTPGALHGRPHVDEATVDRHLPVALGSSGLVEVVIEAGLVGLLVRIVGCDVLQHRSQVQPPVMAEADLLENAAPSVGAIRPSAGNHVAEEVGVVVMPVIRIDDRFQLFQGDAVRTGLGIDHD
jgi:hypothetical protein